MPRLLRFGLYTLYLAAFPLLLAYLAWRPFIAELRLRERPAAIEIHAVGALSTELMRQIGSFSTDRASSFTRFPIAKVEGRRRVCAYGDSFTYGDEVPPNLDFPSQLQQQLAATGHPEIEVLNFGSPWHGFHQNFLVWRATATVMDCDAVLLGPGSFFPERDTSFNHSELHSPYYLHARFVQDGAELRLVEVLGANVRERMERYFSFVPSWRYLRYDRSPPAALRALLPTGRSLPNPFYYDERSAQSEARALQGMLLSQIAAAGRPVLLLHGDPAVVELAAQLAAPTLFAAQLPAWREFPYRARLGHMSAAGNALVARWFLTLLQEPDALPRFAFRETRAPAALEGALLPAQRTPVSHFERVEVRAGDAVLGELVSASPSHWERGLGSPEQFAGTAQRALLLLGGAGAAPADAALLTLPQEPAPGALLALRRARGKGHGAVQPLARLRRLSSQVAVDWAEIPGLEFAEHQQLRWRDPSADASGGGREPAERIEVLLDGRPLLRSAEADPAQLVPEFGRLLQISALPELDVPQDFARRSGRYELVFSRAAEECRVALGDWRELPLSAPPRPPAAVLGAWLH